MSISRVVGNDHGFQKCMWDTLQYNRKKVIQTGKKPERLALVLPTLDKPYIELVDLRPRTVFAITPRKVNGRPRFEVTVLKAYGLPKHKSKRTADD